MSWKERRAFSRNSATICWSISSIWATFRPLAQRIASTSPSSAPDHNVRLRARRRQLTGADQFGRLPDVEVEAPVAIEEVDPRADQLVDGPRGRARPLDPAQLQGLAACDQVDRRDRLRQLDDRAGVAGSDRPP